MLHVCAYVCTCLRRQRLTVEMFLSVAFYLLTCSSPLFESIASSIRFSHLSLWKGVSLNLKLWVRGQPCLQMEFQYSQRCYTVSNQKKKKLLLYLYCVFIHSYTQCIHVQGSWILFSTLCKKKSNCQSNTPSTEPSCWPSMVNSAFCSCPAEELSSQYPPPWAAHH